MEASANRAGTHVNLVYWPKEKVIRIGGVFITYVIAAQLSRFLFHGGTAPAVIWLPAGIAWAALILWGYKLWPAIAAGSLVFYSINDVPFAVAIAGSFGNAFEVFLAAYFLQKANFDRTLARSYDVFLLLVAALFVTTIVPTVVLLASKLTLSTATITWSQRWLGELLSVTILTPFILRWSVPLKKRATQKNIAEAFLIFSLLVGATVLSSWTSHTQWNGISIGYITIIALLWIALRMDMRAIVSAMLLTTGIALSGIVFSGVPALIPGQSISDRLLGSEFALTVFQFIFLALATLTQERNKAMMSVTQYVVQLEEALQRIKDENQGKSDFIAILAHELRNPLASIRSYLELVKMTNVDSEAKEFVTVAERNVVVMSRILDDLLDISRITQQKLTLKKERISLQDIVKRSIEGITPTLHKKAHTLLVTMPEEIIWIEGDSVRIEQVINNILLNAIKYSDPAGGKVEISCVYENRSVTLRIRDNGVGIDSDKLTKIFEPFVQVNKFERNGGLGIGLSLSKKLIELHGGSIEAKSDGRGRGSEFIVRMPISGVSMPQPIFTEKKNTSFLTTARLERKNSYNILVVDDNKEAADGLAKLLQYVGHTVEVAYDGRAAIETFRSFSPDVVLLDIELPEMNGYEVAKFLREEIKSTAILIALTGYGQVEDRAKAENAGFDYHLTKPIALAEIEKILRNKVRNKVMV